MAGLKGHFDSNTEEPPPQYSAQPYPYNTSPHANQGPPPRQQGDNHQAPQPSAYHNPYSSAQSSPPSYPQPGRSSPYLQPQNGPQYTSSPNTKYSPHPSPQLSGKSPRLQPQQSPNFIPQPSPHHSPKSSCNMMANPATTQLRTLHIYKTSSSAGSIADSDKTTPLYTYRTHSWSKPHLELHSTALNALIGTITFHSWTSTIDLTLHNQPLTFDSNGWMQSGHRFVTRAGAPGVQGQLRWKTPGVMSSDQVLLDQRDQVVAKWENSNWAIRKEGKLVLHGPSAVAGPLMDEVVLTRLAEMMQRKRNNSAAAGASGGGAWGGGACGGGA